MLRLELLRFYGGKVGGRAGLFLAVNENLNLTMNSNAILFRLELHLDMNICA